MLNIATLIQQGSTNLWVFIPSAILLGALHGLEPGHSKTMMAAFIVAVRGTVTQAVLLGLAATVSHTAVVWAVALGGLYFGQHLDTEVNEPYFQIASAVMIIGIAAWMMWRTWQHQQFTQQQFTQQQQTRVFRPHDDGHQHHIHNHHHAHHHHHDDHDHHHSHNDSPMGYQDAHELAHANDIKKRFANRDVTTAQIILFGLTGGLIPCPASITVLLLCLQLKQFTLGATLVLCFSIGLALTMVLSGTLAALSVKHAAKHWSGFGAFAAKAPYFSGTLIMLVGVYVGYQGIIALL